MTAVRLFLVLLAASLIVSVSPAQAQVYASVKASGGHVALSRIVPGTGRWQVLVDGRPVPGLTGTSSAPRIIDWARIDGEDQLILARCSDHCRIMSVQVLGGRVRQIAMLPAGLRAITVRQRADRQLEVVYAQVHGHAVTVYRKRGQGRPVAVLGPFAAARTQVTGMNLDRSGAAAVSVTILGGGRRDARMYRIAADDRITVLQRARSGALSAVLIGSPSWLGGQLYWSYARFGDSPSGILLRTDPEGMQEARLPVDGTEALLDLAANAETVSFLLRGEHDRLGAAALSSLQFFPARRGIGLTP